MELIGKDKGGDWYFDGDKSYFCINDKGKKIGKVYAEYLPDPVKIWEEKCKMAEVSMSSKLAEDLKPNDVVWKLWEHKNANAN